MRFNLIILLSIFLVSCSSKKSLDLLDKVEVLRDNNGINHIYANNQRDLFFMQGYLAAKDRLFQFEIWRRQATGTVSEIFGEEELERDIGTRLFMFRGDLVSYSYSCWNSRMGLGISEAIIIYIFYSRINR